MSITDFFFGPWIPQMIPTGSLDGNISITFTICFATVLHEGKKKKFVYCAYVDHKLHNNCTDD